MNKFLLLLRFNNIKMASIAITIGGAIINATAFIGGNYLAKYLSGDPASQEKKRHDLAVEKYEKEYQKYQENRTKLLGWIATDCKIKDKAKQNFNNTDYTLKLLLTECSTKTGRVNLRWSFGPGDWIGSESFPVIKNE